MAVWSSHCPEPGHSKDFKQRRNVSLYRLGSCKIRNDQIDDSNHKSYEEFIFVSSAKTAPHMTSSEICVLLGNIAFAGGSAAIYGSNPVFPIAMACIPIIVPMSIGRASESGMFTFLSDDAKNFVKGITYVSMAQGSLAVVDFMFGDLLSGFMKSIFAAMGIYVSYSDDGPGILPSFTVVSFVNGSISLLSAFERMSGRRSPLFSGVMPLYLNYIHLEQILHPILCFAGAYMGWQIIKELRRSGVIGAAVLSAEAIPAPQARQGRVLSSAGGSTVGFSGTGFEPFRGRGHSLRTMSMASATDEVPERDRIVGGPDNRQDAAPEQAELPTH